MSRVDEVFNRLLHELIKETPESMRPLVHWFFVGYQHTIRARIAERLGTPLPLQQGFETVWGGLRGQQLDPAWIKPGQRVVTDALEHGVIEAVTLRPPESCSVPEPFGYPVRVPCAELKVRLDTGRLLLSIGRVFAELLPPTSVPMEIRLGLSVITPEDAWERLMASADEVEALKSGKSTAHPIGAYMRWRTLDQEIAWCTHLLKSIEVWATQVDVRLYAFYSRAKLRRIYQILSIPIPWTRKRADVSLESDSGDGDPYAAVPDRLSAPTGGIP